MSATAPPAAVDTEGGQSLATGALGTALLAIEQALSGAGDWSTAHRLVARATTSPIDAGSHSSLYYGSPAVLFLLNTATADGHDRYTTARHTLTQHLRRITRTRLAAAHDRLRHGRPARFAEYDVFSGLTGIAALLLGYLPDADEFTDLLTYLVRLTQPRTDQEQRLPGWWVDHDPDPLLPTPGGHANLGMAHGAAGILALLAQAARAGHTVDGQAGAIERLCAWFDRWRQDTPHGPWWPQWVTRDQLRTGRPSQEGPGRPSWCYGAPGIARALQLAAIATHDTARQTTAEAALADCLTTPQLDRLTDPGICHGLAGLYHTAYRAAVDARTPGITARLPLLADHLTRSEPSPGHVGFLTGHTGWSLAVHTASTSTPPRTRWDTCLLIT